MHGPWNSTTSVSVDKWKPHRFVAWMNMAVSKYYAYSRPYTKKIFRKKCRRRWTHFRASSSCWLKVFAWSSRPPSFSLSSSRINRMPSFWLVIALSFSTSTLFSARTFSSCTWWSLLCDETNKSQHIIFCAIMSLGGSMNGYEISEKVDAASGITLIKC